MSSMSSGRGCGAWATSRGRLSPWRSAGSRGSTSGTRLWPPTLARLPVDVIVAAGGSPARAAQHATTTIPIVMLVGVDPVAQGLVVSLARPGGSIIGLTVMTRELSGKRLDLLHEAVPGLSHVALLVDAGNPNRQAHRHAHEAAARVLGIQLLPLEVRGPDEFVGAVQAATQGQAQALIMGTGRRF